MTRVPLGWRSSMSPAALPPWSRARRPAPAGWYAPPAPSEVGCSSAACRGRICCVWLPACRTPGRPACPPAERMQQPALHGLTDDYRHQGGVLAEVLDRGALPDGFGDVGAYVRLSQVYEQINAPVGQFGLATLKLSTATLESTSDSVFTDGTRRLTDLGVQRDQIATDLGRLRRIIGCTMTDRVRSLAGAAAFVDRVALALLSAKEAVALPSLFEAVAGPRPTPWVEERADGK